MALTDDGRTGFLFDDPLFPGRPDARYSDYGDKDADYLMRVTGTCAGLPETDLAVCASVLPAAQVSSLRDALAGSGGQRVTQPSRPARGVLRRGGAHGQHVLPSEADDMNIRFLVEIIFAPSPPGQPEDPQLVQQLLDHAHQPDRAGEGRRRLGAAAARR